jgi:LmbE family N-acetylglucosaminyl deacetylase
VKLTQTHVDLFAPGGGNLESALASTTHLGIGAHPDDLEIMAYPGICACRGQKNLRFSGVVATDGAGSPRSGSSEKLSAPDLVKTRREEQKNAAGLGGYATILQLAHPSSEIRGAGRNSLITDLLEILKIAKPKVLYLHNPADRHETHIAVLLASLAALRQLPSADRPTEIYGCEVWGDLDWVPTKQVVRLPCPAPADFGPSLLRVFRSQVDGKRYDLAAAGRRRAQATFADAYTPDQADEMVLALDLKPLVENSRLTLAEFVSSLTGEFQKQTLERIRRLESSQS